jgi:adenylate cyclase
MIPFLPMFELLRGIFGITDGDGDLAARRKIAGTVLLRDAELTARLPLLFEFLGVADREAPPPELDPEARHRRLIEVVMRLVRARGRQEPAVFLFEDLHWIDPGSEAFLERLAEIAEETRTLVLVNFRPEYRADWMRQACYTALPLASLGERAVEELLDELLGRDPSTAGLRKRIRARAAGNPFFVEEVVYSLLEAGVLERAGDACRMVRPIERLEVPDTVTAVVAARIDRLNETEKRALQTAAVIGRSFSETLLGRVLGRPERELRDVLHVLTESGFVDEDSQHPFSEYAFRHPLMQEVAYGSQLAGQRERIHAAVARELEQLHSDRLDSNAALLAHHEEGAGRRLEAARWHRRAAEWVGIRDVDAAHRHWRAVMALAGQVPESAERDELQLQAHVWMQQLAWRLGFSEEETHRLFSSGVALAERRGERMTVVTLTLGYAIYRGVIGDEEGEYRYGAEAAALADEAGNLFFSLAARAVMASSLHFQGRLREAIEVADWAVGRRPDPAVGDRFWISPYTYLLGLRGVLHSLCGRFDSASVDLERALDLANESGDSESLGCVHGFAVQQARCTGETLSALAHARQMLHVAERTGIPLLLVDAYLSLGSALALSAQWDDSVEALEQALEIADSRRVLLGQKRRILAVLAEAYLGRNEHERARHIAEELLAAPATSRALLVEISAQLVLARALLRVEGEKARDAAHAAISRAALLIEESGARSLAPEIHRALSEVAEHEGDRATRLRELREAHRLYREMAARAHADRIGPLIAQSSDSP